MKALLIKCFSAFTLFYVYYSFIICIFRLNDNQQVYQIKHKMASQLCAQKRLMLTCSNFVSLRCLQDNGCCYQRDNEYSHLEWIIFRTDSKILLSKGLPGSFYYVILKKSVFFRRYVFRWNTVLPLN